MYYYLQYSSKQTSVFTEIVKGIEVIEDQGAKECLEFYLREGEEGVDNLPRLFKEQMINYLKTIPEALKTRLTPPIE